MKKVIASRGMGKTNALMNKALEEVKNGHTVIYICPCNSSSANLFNNRGFDPNKIKFMSFEQFINWRRGKNLKDFSILIDELDYCVSTIVGTTDFTYSLTIGE